MAAPCRPAQLDGGAIQRRGGACPQQLPVHERAAAPSCAVQPVDHRVKQDTQRGLAANDVADGDAPPGDVSGVVGRAVNRIDQPESLICCHPGLTAHFLPDDGITGVGRSHRRADMFFDRQIRLRQHVVNAF